MLAPGLTMEAVADQDPDDPFQIPPFDEKKLPKEYRRAVVPYPTRHWPGTIIVNTGARQLFVVMEGQQALRFGCSVGRDGFRWAGLADVGRKVMWPRWTPPKDMIERSRQLNLRLRGSEEQARLEFTVLLTVQTMNYLHDGGHRVAL